MLTVLKVGIQICDYDTEIELEDFNESGPDKPKLENRRDSKGSKA